MTVIVQGALLQAAAARAAQHDEHPETNLPSVPHIGPFVNVGGSQQEVRPSMHLSHALLLQAKERIL